LFCYYKHKETFPLNGTADERLGIYAFTNATIVKDAQTTITNATLVIQQGKILGINIPVPKEAVVINCKGKFIYPSFIDLYSDYGVAPTTTATGGLEVLVVHNNLLAIQKVLLVGTKPLKQK
jgi:hypothetical protein